MDYDPYTYNPVLRSYFVGNGGFANQRKLPPEKVVIAAENNPDAAAHIYSVWGFLDWLQSFSPDFYNVVANAGLAEPAAVVESGAIAPKSGLSGMGEFENTPGVMEDVSWGAGDAVSEWGDRISKLAAQYMQFDTQKRILDLNIKRAEQGLPPVDSGTLAPSVNFGLTSDTRQMMFWAIGGIVAIGIIMAMKKS